MNVQSYSTLEFNLKDAADSIIEEATANEQMSNAGYDLGDEQIAVFEIRQLDDETYYFKESLYDGDIVYVDDDTEGEYDYFTMVEYITARLQILDQVTDYPRMPESKKSAIEKALALVGIEKYRASQRRDRSGKFGEEGLGGPGAGGGRGRGGASGGTPTGTLRVSGSGLTVGPSGRSSRYIRTGAGAKPATAAKPTAAKPSSKPAASTKPTKPSSTSGVGAAFSRDKDSQRDIKIDDSKLRAAGGKNRDADRKTVLDVYAARVKNFDPSYTIGADGGAVYGKGPKILAAKPAGWPANTPYNPRKMTNKEGDWKTQYPATFSKKDTLDWMNQGDEGARKAQVAIAEIYEFARRRQGNGLNNSDYSIKENSLGTTPKSVNRFLEKAKLAGFDVDIHHMIPASMGGSNLGPNLVALTPKEHAMVHSLEWSAARVYKKDGSVAKQGKWGGTQATFEATGANIKANNIYRAVTQQTTAATRSGNVKAYYKTLNSTPSRKQAAFAAQKAANELYRMKLLPTNKLEDLKLDKEGKPLWSNAKSKNELITKLENNIVKETT